MRLRCICFPTRLHFILYHATIAKHFERNNFPIWKLKDFWVDSFISDGVTIRTHLPWFILRRTAHSLSTIETMWVASRPFAHIVVAAALFVHRNTPCCFAVVVHIGFLCAVLASSCIFTCNLIQSIIKQLVHILLYSACHVIPSISNHSHWQKQPTQTCFAPCQARFPLSRHGPLVPFPLVHVVAKPWTGSLLPWANTYNALPPHLLGCRSRRLVTSWSKIGRLRCKMRSRMPRATDACLASISKGYWCATFG